MRGEPEAIRAATSWEALEQAVVEDATRQLDVSSLHLRTFGGWWTSFHALHPIAPVNQMVEEVVPLSDRELGGFTAMFESPVKVFDVNRRFGMRLLRSKSYNEFWRPYDVDHQLMATLSDAGRPLGFIAVARRRGERTFVEADVARMDGLRAAVLATLMRFEAGRGCAVQDLIVALRLLPIRCALFTQAGELLWLSEEARRALELPQLDLCGKVVVLHNDALRRWREAALDFAASGCLSQRARGLQFQRTSTPTGMVVLVVDDGASAAPPSAVDSAARGWGLTPRQAEVLMELVAGHSNKEIASELACSVRTVEIHVSAVLRKARASSRAELMARVCFPGGGERCSKPRL
jgi:DNA-binding CsgD family transcriptional regulator